MSDINELLEKSVDIDIIEEEHFPQQVGDILEDVENIGTTLEKLKQDIDKYVDLLAEMDLLSGTYAFKLYEYKHEYTTKVEDLKTQQNLLASSKMPKSELVAKIAEIDKNFVIIKKTYDDQVSQINEKKVNIQSKYEKTIHGLDTALECMKLHNKVLLNLLDPSRDENGSMLQLLMEKFGKNVEDYVRLTDHYKDMQFSGWRIVHSEEKIANLLEMRGLKFTKSGSVLTSAGYKLTIQEAVEHGLLDGLHVDWNKYFTGLNIDLGYDESSSESSVDSKLSREDVHYLKETVGKPLTLALAEITAKQPTDPIHYLAHWLFKYRYNQEVDELQASEIDKLTKERERIAIEKWHKFVEMEARGAVMEIVRRAEDIGLANLLRKITESEEEEYQDLYEESKDQLGIYNGPVTGKSKYI